MAIAIRRRPLIDDIAAVQLRNKVYEAQDARKEYDKVRKELGGYSTWACVQKKNTLGAVSTTLLQTLSALSLTWSKRKDNTKTRNALLIKT